MISGYVYADQDAAEPISDSVGEQWGNAALYNVVNVAGGSCALTYSASDLTVDLAAGTITHYGSLVAVASGTAAFTLVVDGTNPRWTWLCLDSTGSPVVVSGTAAATPSVPEYGDRVPLALVYVQSGLTIASNATYRLDKRIPAPIFATQGPQITAASTLPVTHQYHSVTGTTAVTALPTFDAGVIVTLEMASATPFTYNGTSLILQSGSDYYANVGDVMQFTSEGSGNWRESTPVSSLGKTTVKYLTSAMSAVTSSTTYVNVSDGTNTLAIPIGAHQKMLLTADIPMSLAVSSGGGAKFQFTGPAFPTSVHITSISSAWLIATGTTQSIGDLIQATAFSADFGYGPTDGGTPGAREYSAATTNHHVRIWAVVENGTTAGTITLQFAQNSSATGASQVLAGAFLRGEVII